MFMTYIHVIIIIILSRCLYSELSLDLETNPCFKVTNVCAILDADEMVVNISNILLLQVSRSFAQ